MGRMRRDQIGMGRRVKADLPESSYCKRYMDDVEVQQEQASVYVVLDGLLSRYHRQDEQFINPNPNMVRNAWNT